MCEVIKQQELSYADYFSFHQWLRPFLQTDVILFEHIEANINVKEKGL